MPNIPLCILRGQREACTGIAWLDTPSDQDIAITSSSEGTGGGSVLPQNASSGSARSGGGGPGGNIINSSPRAGANSPGLTSPNPRASLASPSPRAVVDAPTHPSKKTGDKAGGSGRDTTGQEGVDANRGNGQGQGRGMGVHQHVLSVGRDGHVVVQDVRNGYFPRQHMARSIAVLSSQVSILSTHSISKPCQ